MADETRYRSDETGRHAHTKSPVGAQARAPHKSEFDSNRSESADEPEKPPQAKQAKHEEERPTNGEERHERRPEGPYKDPADETEQGKLK